jgi:hypothetical protein
LLASAPAATSPAARSEGAAVRLAPEPRRNRVETSRVVALVLVLVLVLILVDAPRGQGRLELVGAEGALEGAEAESDVQRRHGRRGDVDGGGNDDAQGVPAPDEANDQRADPA